MAKYANDDVMDGSLDVIATATTMHVNTSQPATRAAAISSSLADVTLTAGDGNGDYTIANGDVSGRKITVAEQVDVPIDVTGTATHVSLIDGTRLLLVTTCTSQGLTSGGTVTVGAFDDEISDPS